jgi:hypothetical protein
MILTLALPFAASAQDDKQKDKSNKKQLTGTPVLWREPADIASRNLILGAGGEEMKPDLSRLTFVEDRKGGYSTKYLVRDAKGNEWVAKLGKEAQSDTAANRLLWALGYETEIAYLAPKATIEGKGEFENVRLEARPAKVKRAGNWMWEKNPFLNTPEFRGLKIMMLMINNWDMKDDNNEILANRGDTTGAGELRYIISDLGGSFGKTGGVFTRSRNEPEDFVKANFIEKVNGDVIDFNYGGKNQKLFENLKVADARWLSGLLRRLSDEQIKDAFRAANYTAEEVDMLAGALKERINALENPAAAVAKDN